jgi:hypothetical protein
MSLLRVVSVVLLLAIAAPAVPANADGGGSSGADSGVIPCDSTALVNAIDEANAHGGATLNLTPGCTYTLTELNNDDNGLPLITSPITINGNRATIVASHAEGVPFMRLFEVPSAEGRLRLNNLTVTGGELQPSPGLLAPGNALFVRDGGILSAHAARFTANGFVGPPLPPGDGAVGNDHGSVEVTDSAFDHNLGSTGGGVYNNGGTMRLTRTTFENNAATTNLGMGGGVNNGNTGNLILTDSGVIGNTALHGGGGILNEGSMNVTNSTVSKNEAGLEEFQNGFGGGIWNFGTMTVTNSPIVGNRSPVASFAIKGTEAGVDNQGGTLKLVNSPVTNNVAAGAPGGIGNLQGTVELIHSAVTGNKPTNCVGSETSVPGCVG